MLIKMSEANKDNKSFFLFMMENHNKQQIPSDMKQQQTLKAKQISTTKQSNKQSYYNKQNIII